MYIRAHSILVMLVVWSYFLSRAEFRVCLPLKAQTHKAENKNKQKNRTPELNAVLNILRGCCCDVYLTGDSMCDRVEETLARIGGVDVCVCVCVRACVRAVLGKSASHNASLSDLSQ